jgi:hypothetical protein
LATQLGSEETAPYVLALTYDHRRFSPELVRGGGVGLLSRDHRGEWVPAVQRNVGGTPRFILGAWEPRHDLGTYGIDPDLRTAWAVVNRGGDFAVGRVQELL